MSQDLSPRWSETAPSCPVSATSLCQPPTRTEQAPRHSLTGRRATQTAERRERERERKRWRERCRNGLPPQPAKNRVRNTGERRSRSRGHGRRGCNRPAGRVQGVAYPGRTRCAHVSPPAVPNHKARSRAAPGGHEGSEPPGHANVDTDALPMIRAAGKSPVLPARRLWPRGSQPALSPLRPAPRGRARATGPLHPLPGQRGESPAGAAKSTDS